MILHATKMSRFLHVALLVTIALLCASIGQTEHITDVNKLISDLFEVNPYSKIVRPVQNQSLPIQIRISFTISSIKSYDSTTGSLVVIGFTSLSWKDEQLTWDPSNYGGMTLLSMFSDSIWNPQISADLTKENLQTMFSPAWILFDGNVTVYAAGKFQMYCDFNIYLYPFDDHVCTVAFMSVLYLGHQLELVPEADQVQLHSMADNGEWLVSSTTCCQQNMSDNAVYVSGMQCSLVLKRRPGFVMLHIIVPLAFVTLLNVASFWIPVNCGERLSFCVTVFLAFTVFISEVTTEIPRTSIQISLYSVILILTNSVSTFGIIYSIVLLNLSVLADTPVPESLKNLVTKIIVIKKCEEKSRVHLVTVTDTEKNKDDQEKRYEQEQSDEGRNPYNAAFAGGGNEDVTWATVAKALDKIVFWMFIVSSGILVIIFAALVLTA